MSKALLQYMAHLFAGEDNLLGVQRTLSAGRKWVIVSASGPVHTGPGVLLGFIAQAAIATANPIIRDGFGTAGGVLQTCPVGATIGADTYLLKHGIPFSSGLYFDLNGGTGTVGVLLLPA